MISDDSDRFNPRDPKPADAGKPSKSVKRREARQLATQALYQWHMAKQSLNEIEAQFRVDNDFTDVDGAYFREILHGVPQFKTCLLYTSPSPRDRTRSRMPSSA